MTSEYPDKHLKTAMVVHEHKRSWRPADFRVSSLPYCSVLDLADWFEQEEYPQKYSEDFYFHIGTAVHSLWQWYMSNSKYGKRTFGCWKCSAPFCKTRIEKPQFRPSAFPECHPGHGWQYEELTFNYKGISGHCDYVTQDAKGNWVLWELKTASMFQLNPGKKSRYLPYPKHIIQVETYAVLLWYLFKIRVKYINIVYVSRERPQIEWTKTFLTKFTPLRFKYRSQRLKHEVQGRRSVVEALPEITHSWDKEAVEAVVEARPCRSKEDYFSKMDVAFFGEEVCPLFKSGVCAKVDSKPTVKYLKSLWKEADKKTMRSWLPKR